MKLLQFGWSRKRKPVWFNNKISFFSVLMDVLLVFSHTWITFAVQLFEWEFEVVGVWGRAGNKTVEVWWWWWWWWWWWLWFCPFEPIDGSLPHSPPSSVIRAKRTRASQLFVQLHFMRQWKMKEKIWKLTMHSGHHGNDCWRGGLTSAELEDSPIPSWDSRLPLWARRITSAFNIKTKHN